MKFSLIGVLLLTLLIGVSSCQSDETIYDRVVGRTWVGDLNFQDEYGEPLESAVYLGADSYGEDKLAYFDDNRTVRTLRIDWYVDGQTVYIRYGTVAAPREIRGAYVSGGRLSGELYIGGRYIGSVTLRLG